MILEISPDSPLIVRAAAATVLYAHIAGGAVALVAGAGALVFRKGSPPHRLAGHVFFVSMLVMAVIGAAVSPFLNPPQWLNVIAATFTLYLVITGWMTTRRKNNVGAFEMGALLAAVVIVMGCIAFAVQAMNVSLPGIENDPGPAVAFGIVAALAAVGDLRLILRRSLSAMQRTLRHLWRMCYALLIATASLFLGQPQVFPESLRRTSLLAIPVLAVLLTMIFWMVKTRFAKTSVRYSVVARPQSVNTNSPAA